MVSTLRKEEEGHFLIFFFTDVKTAIFVIIRGEYLLKLDHTGKVQVTGGEEGSKAYGAYGVLEI